MFEDPTSQAILAGGVRRAIRTNTHLSNTLAEANANIRYANSVIAQQDEEIARLRKEVADFRLRAIVELAGGEGYKAMYEALKSYHPASPMLTDSGKRYKESGNIKTKARLLYEDAFDRIIRDHQIVNPEEYRAD